MSTDPYFERPAIFETGGSERIGIITRPLAEPRNVGVVVIVGGPQYRVGSHRQFALLARHLGAHGVASIRFDCRGHGDSEGAAPLGDETIDDDVRAAISALLSEVPTLDRIVLWGLCGGASVAALYAPHDPRVAGVVMLNPWVRTSQGVAKARLTHYYLPRLLDRGFWRRALCGKLALGQSTLDFARNVARALTPGGRPAAAGGDTPQTPAEGGPAAGAPALPQQMLSALVRSRVAALVVLSGADDLTANEFRQLRSDSPQWLAWLAQPHVEMAEVAGSNHTFARSDWRTQVEELSMRWVLALATR